MGRYSRLGKNTVLVFIGNAGGKLIGLLMLPFYTSWLSVEEYGTTDIINVYVSFLIGIVSCCIAESVFIFPKGKERNVQREYFTTSIVFVTLSLLFTFLCFWVLSVISQLYEIHNTFTDNVWLVYSLLASMLLQQLMQQFTRSIDKMAVYGIAGLVLTGTTALFAFPLIPRFGVTGFVMSYVFANLTTTFYSLIFSGGYKFLSLSSINCERGKEMLKYSLPLIPNGIMWWLVSALNRPIMESSVGMHSIGLFAVANKFPAIVNMMFLIFVTSWQISVLEEFWKKGYNEYYNKVFRGITLLLLVLFVFVTMSSKLIVSVFASPDYLEAWRLIPILTMGTIFSSLSGMAGTNFSAVRKSKYFFYSSVFGAVAAVIANSVLIPLFGIWGAAAAVIISFAVMSIARIWFSWQFVKMTNVKVYISMLSLTMVYLLLVCASGSTYVNILSGLITLILLTIFNWGLIKNANVKLKGLIYEYTKKDR